MATDGFEEVELTGPMDRLKKEGFTVHLVAERKRLKSWNKGVWGEEFQADLQINELDPAEYDALIIPGGVINADRLRRNKDAVEKIRKFDRDRKLIAAICHGPQLLIEADLVKGKNMTSHPAVSTDMKNAGAEYKEEGVVSTSHYVTAQGPKDIEAFNESILKKLGK